MNHVQDQELRDRMTSGTGKNTNSNSNVNIEDGVGVIARLGVPRQAQGHESEAHPHACAQRGHARHGTWTWPCAESQSAEERRVRRAVIK